MAKCTGGCPGCLTPGYSLRVVYLSGNYATNPFQFKCLKWGVEMIAGDAISQPWRVELMEDTIEGKAKQVQPVGRLQSMEPY
jgi:hypothetical protein